MKRIARSRCRAVTLSGDQAHGIVGLHPREAQRRSCGTPQNAVARCSSLGR
jgi:hypothetical protein